MKVIRGSEIEYEPASHEDPSDPGVLKKVLANKTDLLAGQVPMLNWSLLKTGKSFQRHYHEDMQEVFVILNGEVTMTVETSKGAEPVEASLRGGDATLIDPGEIHRMENSSDEDVCYVVFGISQDQNGRTVVVED